LVQPDRNQTRPRLYRVQPTRNPKTAGQNRVRVWIRGTRSRGLGSPDRGSVPLPTWRAAGSPLSFCSWWSRGEAQTLPCPQPFHTGHPDGAHATGSHPWASGQRVPSTCYLLLGPRPDHSICLYHVHSKWVPSSRVPYGGLLIDMHRPEFTSARATPVPYKVGVYRRVNRRRPMCRKSGILCLLLAQ